MGLIVKVGSPLAIGGSGGGGNTAALEEQLLQQEQALQEQALEISALQQRMSLTLREVQLVAATAVALTGEYSGRFGVTVTDSCIKARHIPDFRPREADLEAYVDYVNADIYDGRIVFRFAKAPSADITGVLLLIDGGGV